MENFLKAASLAWNPIAEVRRRNDDGTLTIGSVLVPFIGVVIACNLFAFAGQRFFYETVLSQFGQEFPNSPLLCDFSLRFFSAIFILAPVAAVSLLPARVFEPSDRNATAAALLILGGAWAFYGAAIGVPIHFVAGVMATVDVESAISTYLLLSVLIALGIPILLISFWLRITLHVLELSGARTFGISTMALAAVAVMAGFLVWIASNFS